MLTMVTVLKVKCSKLIFGHRQGMLMVLLLGWLFLPIYIASGVRRPHIIYHTHTLMHDFVYSIYSSLNSFFSR